MARIGDGELRRDLAYFRECENDKKKYNAEQRRLWKQLADEVEKRLNDRSARDEGQGRLL